ELPHPFADGTHQSQGFSVRPRACRRIQHEVWLEDVNGLIESIACWQFGVFVRAQRKRLGYANTRCAVPHTLVNEAQNTPCVAEMLLLAQTPGAVQNSCDLGCLGDALRTAQECFCRADVGIHVCIDAHGSHSSQGRMSAYVNAAERTLSEVLLP